MLKKIKQKQPVAIDIADAALRPEVPTRLTPTFILFSILLLLLFIATRLHSLLALPAFYDEVGHITWAQQVFHGYALEPLIGAKPLMPYVLALFDPLTSTNGLFVGRVLVALTGLIGIAAMGLGRLLHSNRAGIISGSLWLLCPYLFFFERLTLADATLAAMSTVAAWALVRLIKTETVGAAISAGIVLALCPLAKLTGIIFIVLPVTIIVLSSFASLWHRLKINVILYFSFSIILAIPLIIVLVQPAVLIAQDRPSVLGDPFSADNVLLNSVFVIDALSSYLSTPFLIVLFSMALFGWRQGWQQRLIPLLFFVFPLFFLIFTTKVLYLRYLVIAIPGLLVLSALGIATLMQSLANMTQRPAWWRAYVLLGATFGIWSVAFVGPFMNTAYTNPVALSLPHNDKNEYLLYWSSGFGIREAAADLTIRAIKSNRPIIAVGMLGNCRALNLSLPITALVTILCPYHNESVPTSIAEAHDYIRRQIVQNGSVLVIIETDGPDFESILPANSQLLATYPRPDGDYATVELFRVTSVWPTF